MTHQTTHSPARASESRGVTHVTHNENDIVGKNMYRRVNFREKKIAQRSSVWGALILWSSNFQRQHLLAFGPSPGYISRRAISVDNIARCSWTNPQRSRGNRRETSFRRMCLALRVLRLRGQCVLLRQSVHFTLHSLLRCVDGEPRDGIPGTQIHTAPPPMQAHQ